MIRKWIISFIDFFYPPFSRIMPLQTFRYAACGGSNTLLDIVLYSVFYNFVLQKHDVNLAFMTLSAHVASNFMSFCISFPTGFFLMRNVVFTESTLHGRVQLFRYFVLVLACLGLNVAFLKLFVEQLHLYPTAAKILATPIVVAFSYLSQKKFSFKVEEDQNAD